MKAKISNIFRWAGNQFLIFKTWYKRLYEGKPWYTKTLVGFTSLIAAFALYLVAVDINFLWLFGKSPGFSQIAHPHTSQASEIYSANGQLIGKFFSENRTPVRYKEVNPIFWKTLIDTEDERFYRHFGIDVKGVFAAVKDAITKKDARGASTITQQLAKNMFRTRTNYSTGILGLIPGVKILVMKSKEWIIAIKLEMMYDKNQILTMYANTVDFGSNAYGIKTASKTYFNTTPANLTTDQCAILVGMLKATTLYNPLSNPENSRNRRNVVMKNMVSRGDLQQAAYDSLKMLPIQLDYNVETNYDGQALYFREALADYLKDWCRLNDYDLYSSGLKIHTTIDTRMQKYAERAAIHQMRQIQRNFKNHWGNKEPWVDENGNVIPNFIENIAKRLPTYKVLEAKYPNQPDSIDYYLNKPHKVKLFDYEKGTIEKEISTMDSIRYMVRFMHCSMLAMEPETGFVKAWVGDIDFNSWKYDKVTAMRQPGSTFKLFVYTEAMNQGLTPCDKRRDEYFSMQVYDRQKRKMVTWTPTNADGRFSGDSIPLKSAFGRSINSVAVRLGQEMGINRIIETARKMGIKSPLDDTPSLALGASDVNLLEMVNAYSTVADNGMYHEPVLITKIIDKQGHIVYEGPSTKKQAIPYKSAFFMQQLLMAGVREGGGTSQRLNGFVGNYRDTDWGGKTGTSNNHSDAWFIGVSPKLVVGAWVGGEYRSIHFRTGALGQGARTALPICGDFLQSVLRDPRFEKYHAKFDKPKDDNISLSMYQCQSYFPKAKADTSDIDTMTVMSEEIILDENGNPIKKQIPVQRENNGTENRKAQDKDRLKPMEEPINLDNL